jgi:hypothetical protein
MNDQQFGTLHRSPPIPHWSGTIELPFFLEYGAALIEAEAEPAEVAAEDPELLAARRHIDQVMARLMKSVPPQIATMLPPPRLDVGHPRRRNAQAAAKADADELFDPDNPFDADRPFRRGRFRLVVHDPSGKGKPTDAQRRAFTWLMSEQAEIGRRVLQAIHRDYQETYEARLKWWKQWHGRKPTDEPPAKLTSPEGLKQLIRLERVHIQPRSAAGALPYVGLEFQAVWEPRAGIGAIVHRDGTLELGPSRLAEDVYRPPRQITHPAFGRMRRGTHNFWIAHMRVPFFEEFADAAGNMPSGREQRQFRGPQGELPALFLKGLFEMRVEDKSGEGPSPAQERAFAHFRKNETAVCRSVVDLIYRHYRDNVSDWRGGRYIDRRDEKVLVPRLDSPDGLRRLIRLTLIHIFDDRGRDSEGQPPPLLFGFACTWDEEHGLEIGVTGDEVELVE